MADPMVSPGHTAHRLKQWLLAKRIGQLHGCYEPSSPEHQQPQGESAGGGKLTQEPQVAAQGTIRREPVPLLARYGTSYGLFDEWIADYECVLISDNHRLADYVGDSVWVSGSLIGVITGMPVMKVTRLKLLKMKWMR